MLVQYNLATNQLTNNISKFDRQLGWLIIVGFTYMAFALDWHYKSTGQTSGVWLFGTKPVLAISLGILLFFTDLHLRKPWPATKIMPVEMRYLRRYATLCFFFFLVVLLERLHSSPYDMPFDKVSYWMLFELPFWGLLGYLYADTGEKAHWLLNRLAAIIAVASTGSYILRFLGIFEEGDLFGPAGWPMRLIFMFGFCWYFTRYVGGKVKRSDIFGLIACSLEVIVCLHKPFIFASLLSIPVMLIAFTVTQKWKLALCRRFLLAVLVGAVLVLVLNQASGGRFFAHAQDLIWENYLKTDASHIIKWTDSSEALIMLSGGRLRLWAIAFPRLYDSPLLGAGLGQRMIPGEFTVSLHNGYLDLLLSFGILGVIPVAVAFLCWFKSVIKSCRAGPFSQMQIACLGYIIGILAFNVGSTSRLFIPSSFFMVFFMGVAMRTSMVIRCQSERYRTHSKKRVL